MNLKAVYSQGEMIGGTPYSVVRFLGGGGMGSVYEVEDTTIGKRYVVKTLHGELAHRADLAEMLRHEARLLARVKHKNIVDVITAGKTNDEHALPYLVMEKLDGITLKGLMQTHRLPWAFVRQIANELLEALYRMHHPLEGLQMIHRDIKPENIFLAKDGDGKYITKLLDLGIASWLDGQTHHGFQGTLRYAAPEQLRGDPLSEQTDLYQAGLVFFELLTGRHPFADARKENEMVDATLRRTPPRVTDFVDVPRRVDEVIDAALSKNPTKRPRDAYLFMTALQDLREPSPARGVDFANTTIEDLHTAIAKYTERGYEAYATAEGRTFAGGTAPPVQNRTLEEAFPSFAVASTSASSRVFRGGTAPLAAMREDARMAAGIDRRAATRAARSPAPRRRADNDTEELLEGLMPRDNDEMRALRRRPYGDKLPWERGTPQTVSSRSEREESVRALPHSLGPLRVSGTSRRSYVVARGLGSSTSAPLAGVPEAAARVATAFRMSRRDWFSSAVVLVLSIGLSASLFGRRGADANVATGAANTPSASPPPSASAPLSPTTTVSAAIVGAALPIAAAPVPSVAALVPNVAAALPSVATPVPSVAPAGGVGTASLVKAAAPLAETGVSVVVAPTVDHFRAERIAAGQALQAVPTVSVLAAATVAPPPKPAAFPLRVAAPAKRVEKTPAPAKSVFQDNSYIRTMD